MASILTAQPVAHLAAGADPAESLQAGFGIGTQLAAGFGIVLLLLAVIAFIGWKDATDSSRAAESIYSDSLAPEILLARAQQGLYEVASGQVDPAYASADAATQANIRTNDQRWLQTVENNVRAFREANTDPNEITGMSKWDDAFAGFLGAREQVITLSTRGSPAEAEALRGGQMLPQLQKSAGILQDMMQIQETDGNAINASVKASAQQSSRMLIGLTILAMGAAAAVAVFLARRIGGTAKQVALASRALAAGNLNQQVLVHSRDELGQMAAAFRAMVAYQHRMAAAADAIGRGDLTAEIQPQSADDVLGVALQRMAANLRQLVAEMQQGSRNLAGASAEIFAATSQQSAGTVEQSAAIAQTTTTVDEVRVSAEQSAQLAAAVAATASQANEIAGAGVHAVQTAADGMADIGRRVQSIAENMLILSEQSQQIGEIIAAVNDLADQSNLLALNAAIEASRAGEQGKGFTVVANEIRTLAAQSRAATGQVRGILSDIQRATNSAVMATELGTKGVDAGSLLIEQAGKTIDELAEVILETAQSAQQIAASVRQHAVGMEQIAVAMGNINEVTAQNVAATASTQRATENMTELAGSLDSLVAQYRLS